MDIKVCAFKLWLVLHFTAWTLRHPCSAAELYNVSNGNGTFSYGTFAQLLGSTGTTPAIAVSWDVENKLWEEYLQRRYFYVHNETQIAMAREEAEAARGYDRGSATSTSSTRVLGSGTFPDISPSEDGCSFDNADRDLEYWGVYDGSEWGHSHVDGIQVLAVDSCARYREVSIGSAYLEFCSQRWVKPEKPDILIRDNPDPLTHSFKVLVRISVSVKQSAWPFDVLGEGVYFPATGKMHMVGCTRETFIQEMSDKYTVSFEAPVMVSTSQANPAPSRPEFTTWIDPETRHFPPLNSSTPHDCAISVTLQYPPLHARWNWDRVLKYSIRSKREKDDPLYFDPIERSTFFAYLRRRSELRPEIDEIRLQRRVETGGRILLLVLGLVCLALQIEHGRNNEEALPFVSLVMLGIQLANHLSQTSIFKDLQIGAYRGDMISNGTHEGFQFPDSVSEYKYYGTMAWSEHVPYQAMAMTAIFMYVWIFHRVGDRRRIMNLRVRRKRPGAKDAPSDWRVMYATLAFFSLLCFLGFFAIGADRHGHIRRALTGMTADQERYFATRAHRISEDALYPGLLVSPAASEESPFVSWRFYELSQAHWGFVNKLTGLVVSFFLVPQLLGNMQWELQGRPLSAWFYVGIPFLQSLPHVFSVAKHFQLLPIFPFFDPYINSVYGLYENSSPWWQIGVVVWSTLQVLAVHAQFSRSPIHSASRQTRLELAAIQMAENVL